MWIPTIWTGSNHSKGNSNHSSANLSHSNGIRTIPMQMWITRMQIGAIQTGFETFKRKFVSLECKLESFERDSNISNVNLNHSNIRPGWSSTNHFHVWCMYTYIHIHVHMYICILIWNDQSPSHSTCVPGPCRAKLLRAREEAFWTSTSEECSRWMSGSKMVSDIGSVTEWGCDGMRNECVSYST